VVALVTFVVGVIIGSAVPRSGNNTSTSAPQGPLQTAVVTSSIRTPAASQVPASTPKTTAARTPAPSHAVLLQQHGSGTATTKRFTAPADWDLAWSYDCAAFGSQGNFQVFPNSNNAFASLVPVNQLGRSGKGVEHYHEGGQIYLEINSECSWSVKATAA
jgi:hypothetical protein